jgi:hypothetical protein
MDRSRLEALRAAVNQGNEEELVAFSEAVFERCMATAKKSGGTWDIALNELIPGRIPSPCVSSLDIVLKSTLGPLSGGLPRGSRQNSVWTLNYVKEMCYIWFCHQRR